MRRFCLYVLVAICPFIYSCSGLSYLSQAAKGHHNIMKARVPIEEILNKSLYDTLTQNKLWLALEIRYYASTDLRLPSNKSYQVFSKTTGDTLGWNVYCAPKFSVAAKSWRFPVAGRVVYRGYFSKKDAVRFAVKMDKKGYDVYIAPFSAYSTLGWCKDPVLSSHLKLDTIRLAGLIFHEMAHQQLYIKGDSRFNEAFAVTVERNGVLKWLRSSRRKELIPQALEMWKREDSITAELLEARESLAKIYSSNITSEQMQQKKDSILESLIKKYSSSNEKYSRINNAFFIPVSTYHSIVPAFQKLLDSEHGTMHKFYEKAGQLAKLPYKERQKRIEEILSSK